MDSRLRGNDEKVDFCFRRNDIKMDSRLRGNDVKMDSCFRRNDNHTGNAVGKRKGSE
jgi:hypothetical protein